MRTYNSARLWTHLGFGLDAGFKNQRVAGVCFGLRLDDLGLNIGSGYACRGTRHNHLPLNRLIPMMKILRIRLMIMTMAPRWAPAVGV
jgi:hypothetical protein